MKRIFIVSLFMCFISCLGPLTTKAQALDVNTLFTALKNELGDKVVAASDINAAEQPIKKLLGMGASLAEVKTVLLDFIGKGFKGNDLNSLVSCVSDLMKNKEAIKTAASFVSQAIGQASAMGLKGKDLIAKVQGLVSQKKVSQDLLDKKGLSSFFGK